VSNKARGQELAMRCFLVSAILGSVLAVPANLDQRLAAIENKVKTLEPSAEDKSQEIMLAGNPDNVKETDRYWVGSCHCTHDTTINPACVGRCSPGCHCPQGGCYSADGHQGGCDDGETNDKICAKANGDIIEYNFGDCDAPGYQGCWELVGDPLTNKCRDTFEVGAACHGDTQCKTGKCWDGRGSLWSCEPMGSKFTVGLKDNYYDHGVDGGDTFCQCQPSSGDYVTPKCRPTSWKGYCRPENGNHSPENPPRCKRTSPGGTSCLECAEGFENLGRRFGEENTCCPPGALDARGYIRMGGCN